MGATVGWQPITGKWEMEMKKLCWVVVVLFVYTVPLTHAAEGDAAGLFPLGKAMAADKELPRPFGVGATVHYQKQGYSLSRMTVSLPNVNLAQAAGLDIDNELIEMDVTADLWVLPFLNVFGLIGRIDGETEVDLSSVQLGGLTIDYDGVVYGGGVTLAGGIDNVFASLTAIFTDTHLDQSDSSVQAWILTPRIGVSTRIPESDRPVTLWAGAMYQQTDEEHSGSIAAAQLGTVAYDVELEEDSAWNALVGVATELSDHWNLELEAGGSSRSQVTLTATCRF